MQIRKKGMKFKKNLLLWNYWANLNQTSLKWFLDGPLPKLCPVIPTSNQDGHQVQNRKKGGFSEEKIFFKFHTPFFLICIIGQNRQKFKVHKKSCNIC
jgi:hypothetical protein